MSKIKQPDSVKTLIANAAGQKFGDPSCRVRNPRITARESIEIADYIVALLEGEGTPPVDPSGVDDVKRFHAEVQFSVTGRLYAERDALLLDQLGGYYFRHVSGMTREQLHSKADIAAELAHRDMLLDAAAARLTAVMSERAAEASAYAEKIRQKPRVQYRCRFCDAGGASLDADAPLFYNCHVCGASNAMMPDRMHAELVQMIERNEATKAQLNLLLVEASGVLGTKAPARRFHFARLANAVKATKTACLADRDAEKGRAGFLAGCDLIMTLTAEGQATGAYSAHADDYADKIRRGEA